MALLKSDLSCIDSSIEVNTVDQYQGRDKEVIIYSCTKNTVSEVINLLILLWLFNILHLYSF